MNTDVLQNFVAESRRAIGRVAEQLAAFDAEPDSAPAWGDAVDTFHSIRIACGFIGLAELGAAALAAERVFRRLDVEAGEANPPPLAQARSAIEHVTAILEDVAAFRRDDEIRNPKSEIRNKSEARNLETEEPRISRTTAEEEPAKLVPDDGSAATLRDVDGFGDGLADELPAADPANAEEAAEAPVAYVVPPQPEPTCERPWQRPGTPLLLLRTLGGERVAVELSRVVRTCEVDRESLDRTDDGWFVADGSDRTPAELLEPGGPLPARVRLIVVSARGRRVAFAVAAIEGFAQVEIDRQDRPTVRDVLGTAFVDGTAFDVLDVDARLEQLAARRRGRVLVVGESLFHRLLTAAVLERNGYEPVTDPPVEGRRGEPVDAIVCDLGTGDDDLAGRISNPSVLLVARGFDGPTIALVDDTSSTDPAPEFDRLLDRSHPMQLPAVLDELLRTAPEPLELRSA